MTERDSGRATFYAAERLVLRLFDRAGSGSVQLAGTTLTLPMEAKFGSIESVERYVGQVLAMDSVRATFGRATIAVSVRGRKGHRAAEYRREVGSGEIAIPSSGTGAWALRELVVLHEVAHHLEDTGGPAHGAAFVNDLITLVGLVLGPEAAFAYRVILTDAGAVRR